MRRGEDVEEERVRGWRGTNSVKGARGTMDSGAVGEREKRGMNSRLNEHEMQRRMNKRD